MTCLFAGTARSLNSVLCHSSPSGRLSFHVPNAPLVFLSFCLYGVVSNCLVCTHGIKFNLGVACLAVSTLVFLCLRSQFLGVLCGNCSGRLCGHSGCSSRSDRCIICVNHNRIYSEILIGTVAPRHQTSENHHIPSEWLRPQSW